MGGILINIELKNNNNKNVPLYNAYERDANQQ